MPPPTLKSHLLLSSCACAEASTPRAIGNARKNRKRSISSSYETIAFRLRRQNLSIITATKKMQRQRTVTSGTHSKPDPTCACTCLFNSQCALRKRRCIPSFRTPKASSHRPRSRFSKLLAGEFFSSCANCSKAINARGTHESFKTTCFRDGAALWRDSRKVIWSFR